MHKVAVLTNVNAVYPDYVAIAASVCKGKNPDEYLQKSTPESRLALVHKLLDLDHMSPFEHVSVTFYLDGWSRACLDQLNRYRIASICMESLRHVNVHDRTLVVPQSIKGDNLAILGEAYSAVKKAYSTLIANGVPIEDARCILPLGISTNELFTCNLRELAHILQERGCTQAQKEIRYLALRMQLAVEASCPSMKEFMQSRQASSKCGTCTTPCGSKRS